MAYIIREFEILDSDKIENFVKENKIDIGILCVPKNGAQELADRLVACGIKGLWNFAPIDLNVPEDIIVENVNLTESLIILLNKYIVIRLLSLDMIE